MTEYGLRIADSPNTLAPAAAEPPSDTISLARLLTAAWRRRRAILVPTLVWFALGVAYLVTTPRSYVASSTLLLDADTNQVVERLAAMDDQTLSESAIENARLVIQSDTLARAVVDKLGLTGNDSFLHPPRSVLSNLVGGVVGVLRAPLNLLRQAPPSAARAAGASDGGESQLRDRVAQTLSGQIGVGRIGRSGAISVYYTSHDPVIAAAVVNAYAEAYIADVLNANFESTERTTEWLQTRLSDLEAAAASAAAEAESFRARNGLVSSDGRFMSEESVSQLNLDLGEAIVEAARSRALVEGYTAVAARGIEGLRSGASVDIDATVDPALAELQATLADAVADRNRIAASYGEDHPQAARLSAEIGTASERLFIGIQQRLQRATGELSVAEARVQALRDSLGIAMGDNAEAGAAQVELRALEQRAETLSLLYQTFLTKFQEIDQQKDFPISDVRILSAADVPLAADSPRASRVLAAVLVIGLFFGVALAAFREWGDRFLRTGDDITQSVGVPFLGYLPETSPAASRPGLRVWLSNALRRRRPPVPSAAVGLTDEVAFAEPDLQRRNNSIYMETLQYIRLRMEMLQTGDPRQPLILRHGRGEMDAAPVPRGILGITSLRPGEGKSMVSLNLATTLAASGASVLLIDADMRRPGLSLHLGLTEGPSLVDVAMGRTDWTDAIIASEPPSLDILPCVRPEGRGHVADLLASKPIRAMLKDVRQRYDHVLIDLAPLGPVVDARVIMRVIGHVLMVAEWGVTPRAMLRKAVESDPILAERLVGVVLNRVDMTAFEDYADRASVDAYLGQYGEYLCS
jgi:succinoglycan biosynthesis transport protein ExoP